MGNAAPAALRPYIPAFLRPQDSPIMYNAKLGNADWLRERVNKMNRRTRKAALSDGYHDNITPLHRAAQNGFVDACRALVDGGCDVNKQDVDYKTPLYYSVEANQDEVVKYLTQQVKARTTRSMTRKLDDGTVITVELESPLHKACEKGFLECVKELVKGGADSNLIIDDGYLLFGDTPLHRAASAGHSDVVRFLIEQGANIDKGDNDGNTALHRAAYRGYEPVCQLLVREGANLDAINGRNETPRDMSRKGNAIAVDQYFSGCNPNVLSECAKRRRDREKSLGIGQFASDTAAMPWQRKASALAAAAADVPETADASADAAAADETAPPPDADASPDDDEDAAAMHPLRRRLSSIRVGLFGSSLSLSSKGGNESPDSGRRQSSPMALLTRMGSSMGGGLRMGSGPRTPSAKVVAVEMTEPGSERPASPDDAAAAEPQDDNGADEAATGSPAAADTAQSPTAGDNPASLGEKNDIAAKNGAKRQLSFDF